MKGRDPLVLYYTVQYTTINYGELGFQLSLKENQKRTVSYREKIRTHGVLNGFPAGRNLELTVIVGENPITMILIIMHNHQSYLYITAVIQTQKV